jgi:hypothetical protein
MFTTRAFAREMSGLAFGGALVGGFAYFFRFHRRQLVILPFVLAGWFLAMQTVISLSASHGSLPESQQYARCANVGSSLAELGPVDSAGGESNADAALANECARFWRFRYEEGTAVLKDFAVWLAAGAIVAMITAIGVPVATRRIVSFISIGATTAGGAVVAATWWAIVMWGKPQEVTEWFWTFLFVAWQAVVGGLIGRSIR